MIKSYTTMPVGVHDSDYPWYKPGYRPDHTCNYPYQFPFYNSYPSSRVIMACKPGCRCHKCMHKRHHNHKGGFGIGLRVSLPRWLMWLLAAFFIYRFRNSIKLLNY